MIKNVNDYITRLCFHISESSNSKKKKKLPDLDKYWKAVNEDTSDFTGWTYLLQYVDQEVSYYFSGASQSMFL